MRGDEQVLRELERIRKEYTDLQDHSYIGHIVKCPTCGTNLTSLLLCPDCGIRFKLVRADESENTNA